MTRYKATVDGKIPFTPEEEAAADLVDAENAAAIVAKEQAVQAEAADRACILDNAIIQTLKTHTATEIDTMVEGMFSALAGMSDSAIDAYINGRTIEADTKAILSILSKDVKNITQLLKINTTIAVYLAKKHIEGA